MRGLLLVLLMAAAVGCRSTASPSLAPDMFREPARGSAFPLFSGEVERPVWLRPTRVDDRGRTIVRGETRANMDPATLAYTDVPLMSGPEPCSTKACARFDIPVTRRDRQVTVPAGARRPGAWAYERSRTLESPDGRTRAVEWIVVEHEEDRATLKVTLVVGLFDPGTRLPLGYTIGVVEAAPVEAGVVYVYRACEAGCDRLVGDPGRLEQITLIGPEATWISSSDDPLQDGRTSEFSVVSTRARPGAAESVVMNFTREASSRFARAAAPETPWTTETVMLDVVWAAGEAPELILHRGLFLDDRDSPNLVLPRPGER